MPDTPEQIVTRYLDRFAEIRSTGPLEDCAYLHRSP
jgi:hypothetical protein